LLSKRGQKKAISSQKRHVPDATPSGKHSRYARSAIAISAVTTLDWVTVSDKKKGEGIYI
jgi:hypothetical protein